MNRKTLPVALIQERNHGDAEANLAVIERRVAEAAKRGAKLVLLQELHNGAYFCQHESVDEFDLAEPIPGPAKFLWPTGECCFSTSCRNTARIRSTCSGSRLRAVR